MAKRSHKVISDSESSYYSSIQSTSTTINDSNCESEDTDELYSDEDEQGNLKDLVVDDDAPVRIKHIQTTISNQILKDCKFFDKSKSSSESETDENIDKVIDNDISDDEFNKDNKDTDINLLSKELSNNLSISNKKFEECYEELNEFFNKNVYNYSPDKKDKDKKKIIMKAFYIKNGKKYDNIEFKQNKNLTFSLFKDNKKQEDIYLRCQYVVRSDYSFLFIKISEYPIFLKLLNAVANHPDITKEKYNKYRLDIIETYSLICPLLFDIDYHYKNKYDGKRLYEEIIDIILKEIKKLVKKHYKLKEILKYYVFYKDEISDDKDGYKDGFHIFVDIPIKITDYMFIHDELVERLKKYEEIINWFKKYEIETLLKNFIDTHLKDRPYMMIGCSKYLPPFYKASPVYKLNINKSKDKNIEEFKKNSVINCSIQKYLLNNIDALEYNKPFNNNVKKTSSKKQKINNEADIETPTITIEKKNKDIYKINLENTLDDIEFLTSLVDPEDIGIGKYSNWMGLGFGIESYQETYNDDETKGRLNIIVHNLMRRGEGYNYKDTERLINDYDSNKGEFTLATLHFFAQKGNKEEYDKFIKERMKRLNKDKEDLLLKLSDNNIAYQEDYDIIFEKENFSNKTMSDIFLYKNVIEALKYFYKYHIYDGNNIYRLQFTTENKKTIIEFSNEIKKQSYKDDMNNIKELNDKEVELINNTDEYGMNFIKDAIICKKIKTDKGAIFKKSIKLYDALSKTLQFNISIKSDDLLKNSLVYGINYYNKYDIIVKRLQYFNTSIIAKYFYFDDILSSNFIVNDIPDLIKPFIKYIDDVICTIKKNDDEKNDDYYNVIEQKKYYVYNYLKSIFKRSKNNTAILLIAKKAGTGKTSFSKLINAVISNNLGSTIPGEDFLNDTYNGADMDNKLFISLEEVEIADTMQQRINISNKIKNLITNDTVRIRKIRQDPKNKENFVSYCITSNAYCPVIMDNEAMNRRFAVFEINNKQSDKFYTDFHNLLENKEAVRIFYNFIKNNEFHCHCKSPNCPEHSEKPFEQRDAIMTPEKKKLIYSCANSDEKFLVDFYYLCNYAITKNKKFKHLDKDDNTKINITYSQLYIEYKKYCKFLEIKPHSKEFFKTYCDDDLLTRFRESYYTERIYKTINEYREWLFNKKLIADVDDYNFNDEYEVFEYADFYFNGKTINF